MSDAAYFNQECKIRLSKRRYPNTVIANRRRRFLFLFFILAFNIWNNEYREDMQIPKIVFSDYNGSCQKHYSNETVGGGLERQKATDRNSNGLL